MKIIGIILVILGLGNLVLPLDSYLNLKFENRLYASLIVAGIGAAMYYFKNRADKKREEEQKQELQKLVSEAREEAVAEVVTKITEKVGKEPDYADAPEDTDPSESIANTLLDDSFLEKYINEICKLTDKKYSEVAIELKYFHNFCIDISLHQVKIEDGVKEEVRTLFSEKWLEKTAREFTKLSEEEISNNLNERLELYTETVRKSKPGSFLDGIHLNLGSAFEKLLGISDLHVRTLIGSIYHLVFTAVVTSFQKINMIE